MKEFIFSNVINVQAATFLQNKDLRYFLKKSDYIGTPVLRKTFRCLLPPLLHGGVCVKDMY